MKLRHDSYLCGGKAGAGSNRQPIKKIWIGNEMGHIGKRKKRITCTMDTRQAAQIEREAKQEDKSIGAYLCELAFMGREVYYDKEVVADRGE